MKINILNARIGFAHGIFKASALEEGQTPKYGADFIIGKDTKIVIVNEDKSRTSSTMRQVMLTVANEAWKGKGEDVLADLEASKKCFRNGDRRVNKSGEIYDGYEGNTYVTAKSTVRPTVLGRRKEPITEADGKIYSGCYVNAIISIYANTVPKKKGVFAGLEGVQFVADGEAFGGGGPAKEDDFADLGDYADGADSDDLG